MYTANNAPSAIRLLASLLVGLLAGLPVHSIGFVMAQEAPAAVSEDASAAATEEVTPAPVAVSAPTRDRRVAVFTFSGKRGMESMADAIGTLARTAVENLSGITVAPGAGVVDDGKVVEAAGLLASIDAGLNEDSDANPDAIALALAESQRAVALLKETSGVADTRTWALAWKNLAVAQALSLQPGPASEAMRASLLLYPDQEVVEYGYSIGVENLFQRVRGDMATDSNGSVFITSQPEGAEVRIGGKARGFTPVEVTGLTPGLHRVEVSMDGQMHSEAFVPITEGGDTNHAVTLTPAPFSRALSTSLKGIKRVFNPRKATMFMEQLRTALGADELLVLRVKPGRSNAVNIDVLHQGFGDAVQQISEQIPRDSTFFDQVRGMLSNRLGAVSEPSVTGGPLSMPSRGMDTVGMGADGLVIDPDSPLFKDAEGGTGDELVNQWWFWTAIGVGVAGAVAAIVVPLVLSAEEADDGPTGVIQFNFSEL